MSARAGAPLLSLEEITCRFGTVVALDHVTMHVVPGSVHALLGENGAGKTTLMRIAFGLQHPTAGHVSVHGVRQAALSPAHAIAHGIGMVHQHFTLVPAMSVAENVALGGTGLFHLAQAEQRVRDIAARSGLVIDPSAIVNTLSVGAQQRCEIVKALARDAQLLILDEPTAVLAPTEANELLQWIRRFADAGGAVVLITHKLRDAVQFADTVTVLRHGKVTLSATVKATVKATLTEQVLMNAMVGESTLANVDTARPSAGDPSSKVANQPATTILALDHVHVRNDRGVTCVNDVSFTVRAGEIVGIAAIEGAGHHELLQVLAGRREVTQGSVVRPARIGYVPEDRHRDALLLTAPLYENIALKGAGARTGTMPWRTIKAATSSLLAARSVVSSSVYALARTLSGGNQQKLVLARELADAPEALVAVNPSRGLDFLATRAVHSAVRSARDAGAAIVMYSSDLDEVIALSDRVFAMSDGQLVETARTREALGNAMLGSCASVRAE